MQTTNMESNTRPINKEYTATTLCTPAVSNMTFMGNPEDAARYDLYGINHSCIFCENCLQMRIKSCDKCTKSEEDVKETMDFFPIGKKVSDSISYGWAPRAVPPFRPRTCNFTGCIISHGLSADMKKKYAAGGFMHRMEAARNKQSPTHQKVDKSLGKPWYLVKSDDGEIRLYWLKVII
jgi:hypothetical protein